MNVVAQVFGVGAMASLFLIYQQTTRKRMICAKLCADVCWSVHYLCLGAYGGIVPNTVGIFRELVFMRRDEKKWASRAFVPIIFIIINWCIGLFTFSSPINILPIVASTFVTISLWLRKPMLTKLISIPVSIIFLIYDIFVGSYIGVVNESIAITSIIINFLKKGKKRNEQQ